MKNNQKSAGKPTFQPATNLLKNSYTLVKDNLKLVVGIYGVTTIVSLLSEFNGQQIIAEQGQAVTMRQVLESIFGLNLQITIALLLVLMVFLVIQLQAQVRIVRGKKVSVAELWEATRNQFFPLFVLQVLMGLAIVLGTIAFILPAFWVLTRLSMAPYVMADKNTGIVDALRSSFTMTKGHWKPIWTMYVLLLACVIIPTLSIFGAPGLLISAVATVVTTFMPALRYKELADQK